MTSAVETARTHLLESVRKKHRPTLESALKLIALRQDDASNDRYHQLAREYGGRRAYASSACMKACWDAFLTLANRAADEMIDACFQAGAKDDDLVAAYVGGHMRRSLESTMLSRFGHQNAAMKAAAVGLMSAGSQVASRMRDWVRVRRADFERELPPRLDRLVAAAKNRPLIAGGILAFTLATSVVGGVETFKSLAEWLRLCSVHH